MTVRHSARRILIVDDDPAAAELIQYILQNEGFQTSLAVTGAAGIAMTRDQQPDLILLDVMLPEMDGFQVCPRCMTE